MAKVTWVIVRACTRCGLPLSRYNTETICGPCNFNQRSNGWAWDTPEFRAALIAGKPGLALAAVRTAAGLSQHDFATVLGWSLSSYIRAERGQSQTLYDIRELVRVADVLGIPRDVLILLVSDGGGEETDMDRRNLGKAALAAGAAFSAIPIFGEATAHAQTAGRVSASHVTMLRAEVDRINEYGQRHGSTGIAAAAAQGYQRARQLLDNGDYPDNTGKELASAVGDYAECIGWLAYDANQQKLARTLYNEALELAEYSRDTGLQIRTLVSLTRQSCHLAPRQGAGMARDAVRLSARVAEISRWQRSSPRAQALIAAREALAHAAAGDRAGFSAAMMQAWREVDRGFEDEADGEPAWFGFVTVPDIRAHEAKGWRYLGQPRRAMELYQAIVSPAAGPSREQTTYVINLANVLVTLGETVQAISYGMRALHELAGPVQSPRLLDDLRPVRMTAAQQPDDDAGEFVRQYDRLRNARSVESAA